MVCLLNFANCLSKISVKIHATFNIVLLLYSIKKTNSFFFIHIKFVFIVKQPLKYHQSCGCKRIKNEYNNNIVIIH